jgi:alkanesulfonate monooxygenase SsuD/methylene tetrahydromethanopterin reductase-like flavin-dependent oxidoreductase (luciferase family)
VVIVRFADDLVVGFQHRADAERFYADLVQRFARFGLETRFSITARSSPAVSTAIASIRADAWTPIHYPNAIWDEAEQRLISDAEIAEVPFTAFTSRRTADHISGRLIVRRVKRLNPTAKTATSGAGGDRQGELFAHLDEHDHGYGITECVPSRQPPLWPTLRCIEIS